MQWQSTSKPWKTMTCNAQHVIQLYSWKHTYDRIATRLPLWPAAISQTIQKKRRGERKPVHVYMVIVINLNPFADLPWGVVFVSFIDGKRDTEHYSGVCRSWGLLCFHLLPSGVWSRDTKFSYSNDASPHYFKRCEGLHLALLGRQVDSSSTAATWLTAR